MFRYSGRREANRPETCPEIQQDTGTGCFLLRELSLTHNEPNKSASAAVRVGERMDQSKPEMCTCSCMRKGNELPTDGAQTDFWLQVATVATDGIAKLHTTRVVCKLCERCCCSGQTRNLTGTAKIIKKVSSICCVPLFVKPLERALNSSNRRIVLYERT